MQIIPITDKYEEQVAVGREIFEKHPEEYSGARIAMILGDIERINPKASKDKKDELFYHSIYDYWVYGNNTREEFFYDFPHKTHLEKTKYITFRNRFRYYELLNNQEDELVFKNKYETFRRFEPFFGRNVVEITGRDDYDKFVSFVNKHNIFF